MKIQKYYYIIQTAVKRKLSYRFNVYTYRIGNILEISALLIIWSVIYAKISVVQGYTYSEMISYVLIGWVFSYLTSNYHAENQIAYHIQNGQLSSYLTKPISYLKYMIAFTIGRLAFTAIVVFIIQVIIITFLKDKIVIDLSVEKIFLLAGLVITGFLINLFISFLTGFIAFWATYIGGTYATISAFSKLASGKYFPFNALSPIFSQVALALPFAYTHYVPVMIYLGKISLREGLFRLGISLVWIVILSVAVRIIWHFGLKKYEGVGI